MVGNNEYCMCEAAVPDLLLPLGSSCMWLYQLLVDTNHTMHFDEALTGFGSDNDQQHQC